MASTLYGTIFGENKTAETFTVSVDIPENRSIIGGDVFNSRAIGLKRDDTGKVIMVMGLDVPARMDLNEDNFFSFLEYLVYTQGTPQPEEHPQTIEYKFNTKTSNKIKVRSVKAVRTVGARHLILTGDDVVLHLVAEGKTSYRLFVKPKTTIRDYFISTSRFANKVSHHHVGLDETGLCVTVYGRDSEKKPVVLGEYHSPYASPLEGEALNRWVVGLTNPELTPASFSCEDERGGDTYLMWKSFNGFHYLVSKDGKVKLTFNDEPVTSAMRVVHGVFMKMKNAHETNPDLKLSVDGQLLSVEEIIDGWVKSVGEMWVTGKYVKGMPFMVIEFARKLDSQLQD